MTILDDILRNKIKEIEGQKETVPPGELEKWPFFARETLPLTRSLLDPLLTSVIAEFKRRSPSRGTINDSASADEVTSGYALHGASGLSVLTDYRYFGGSAADLISARKANNIPVLRKDFIIDEYQVIESKAIGADVILLIAAALEKRALRSLAILAKSLGLQVLLEIHRSDELDYINENIDIVGVKKRELSTFHVDTRISEELARLIPSGFTRISESGISSVQTIRELKRAGFEGFLIGESFMRTADPVAAFANFIRQLMQREDED